jgi:hypothetical protein
MIDKFNWQCWSDPQAAEAAVITLGSFYSNLHLQLYGH